MSRPRRVLMVAAASNVHTRRWATYFVEQGYEVMILSQGRAMVEGVRVIEFPPTDVWWAKLPRVRYGGGWPLWLAGWRRWQRIVTALSPDIIHVHFIRGEARDYFYYRGFPNLIVSTYGTDVVFDPDDPPPPAAARRIKSLLGQATLVTATTRFLATETRKFMPAAKPIHVVPFGVDCDHFKPSPPVRDNLSGTVVLGFAKQHLDQKYGPDVLLDAFAMIKAQRPATRLIFAGSDGMEASLRRRSADLGLSGCVDFVGRLPHTSVPDLLHRLDIFVMPSVCREAFGVAAIEASACGVPVVASAAGGVGEAVIDGQTGVLVCPRDPSALAAACLRLIDEPATRRVLGEAGRHFVLAHYNWLDTAARMRSLYESLPARREVVTPPQYAVSPTWACRDR